VIDTITDGDSPRGLSRPAYAATNEPMVLEYAAHSAPMQMTFYTADRFPAAYRNDAFVAMRGSWNRKPASGYKVVPSASTTPAGPPGSRTSPPDD
jgi:glucose/arabinose dehydrogenase